MATKERIDFALDNHLINDETALLLKEYNERLQSNNVPIIYNLRHLRKILKFWKRTQ